MVSIEDPFDQVLRSHIGQLNARVRVCAWQDDFKHYSELTAKIGNKVQIVGGSRTGTFG